MKSDGELFSELRRGKQISQKEVCGEKLSRTTLSKFENNKINLSMNLFTHLLDSIDLTFEEFKYIQNGYALTKKDEIYDSFFSLFSNQEKEKMLEIQKKCDFYLKDSYSQIIKFISEVINSLTSLSKEVSGDYWCLSKIEVTNVWESIQKRDQWTLSEIRLVNCCLFLFTKTTALNIGNDLIFQLDKYQKMTDISSLKCSILLNMSLLCIEIEDFFQASSLSTEALSVSKKSKRYDYFALSLIRQGISQNVIEKVDASIAIAEFFEDDVLLQMLREERLSFEKSQSK